jgi:excisionase family DNA binding protein
MESREVRTISDKRRPYLPLLVSKRDAAALLSLCLRSIDNLIAGKQLPYRRIGKRVLIPYSALVAFARRDHPNSPDPKAAAERDA